MPAIFPHAQCAAPSAHARAAGRSHALIRLLSLARAKPRAAESTEGMAKAREEMEQDSRGRERGGKRQAAGKTQFFLGIPDTTDTSN